MAMENWKNKHSFLDNIPEEVICFNHETIYNRVSDMCDIVHNILEKDWNKDWILGSDLPFKYAVNLYIYTPFKQIKKGMKDKSKSVMKDWKR